MFLSPPKVIPTFQHKVDVADHGSALAGVVSRMSTRKFSQLPVIKDGRFIGVLTTNTIARWLGAHAADGMALLDDTTVGNVLDHTECPENYVFVSRSTTLFQVLDHFDRFESQGRALDAILITEQGKSTTAFLGIITFYDIPRIPQAPWGKAWCGRKIRRITTTSTRRSGPSRRLHRTQAPRRPQPRIMWNVMRTGGIPFLPYES